MGSIVAAVIAVSGAMIVGYITNFVAEDFRRFRDGTALAASLAGELNSHAEAMPILRKMLEDHISIIASGKRPSFRAIDAITDPIFDAAVGKLGLLGSEMVEDVVFTYQQIRAFRISMSIISKEHAAMSDEEIVNRHRACLQAIERAEERGVPLIVDLKNHANQRYHAPRPWAWWG